jgi:hypothetical protein
VLRREADGSLYDIDERRWVSLSELRDEVRIGRRFRASRHDTGANCTNEVLAELLQGGALPGMKDAGASSLGSLAGLLRMVGGGIVQALDERHREGERLFGSKRRARPSRPPGDVER